LRAAVDQIFGSPRIQGRGFYRRKNDLFGGSICATEEIPNKDYGSILILVKTMMSSLAFVNAEQ
jgi:hypothetical protein